jgi:diketogulonate reductase-like aldo/keto reductase
MCRTELRRGQSWAENHYGTTVAQIVFRFAIDVGMLPLTGTTNVGHMSADLEVFRLEAHEIQRIENLAE